ncbi:MAG: TetR/AcrR family transcriptional regulator [Rubrobacteraceae bacterium]
MESNSAGRGRTARSGSSGPGQRSNRKADRVKRSILEAATEVLVENRGASMQEIADAAEVGRTTVHRYFPGREDLIRAVALQAVAESEAAIEAARLGEGPVEHAVRRLAEALVPMGHRFHFLLDEAQLLSDPEYRATEQRFVKPLEKLAERGRHEGVFRAEVPVAWIVDTTGALVFAAWEGIRDGRIAALDAPNLVATTLLSGVGVPPDQE